METVLADPHVLQGVVVALFAVLLLVFVYALGQRSALKSLAAMQAVPPDVPARQNSQSCTIMHDAQYADPVPTAPDIATSCANPPAAVSLAAVGEALPSAAAGGVAADGAAADGQPVRYVAGRAVRPDGTVVHLKRMHDQKSLRDFVQRMRDEADLPAESNAPEHIMERVFPVSWMRPADLYTYYRHWCRDNAIVPDNHNGFMSEVMCVPGVHYARHRLKGPAFEHIRAHTKKDRAWIIRIESNAERAEADRREQKQTRARSGAARSRTGVAGPQAGTSKPKAPERAVMPVGFAGAGEPDQRAAA